MVSTPINLTIDANVLLIQTAIIIMISINRIDVMKNLLQDTQIDTPSLCPTSIIYIVIMIEEQTAICAGFQHGLLVTLGLRDKLNMTSTLV